MRPFGRDDFVDVFAPFLGVGLLMILVSGATVALRPRAPQVHALFVVCLAIGLILITGPDTYWPYWFTPVAFFATCLLPPASVQLALTFPRRRAVPRRRPLLYAVLYAPFLALAGALLSTRQEPGLFLPLLYTVYFFIANGTLLNVGRGHFRETRNLRWTCRHQPSHCHRRRCESDGSRHRNEHGGFREEVQHHAGTSGAERFADGELALPRFGSHEREVGDVGARDEQQQHRGGRHRPERARDRAGDVFLERYQHRNGMHLIHDLPRRDAGNGFQ